MSLDPTRITGFGERAGFHTVIGTFRTTHESPDELENLGAGT